MAFKIISLNILISYYFSIFFLPINYDYDLITIITFLNNSLHSILSQDLSFLKLIIDQAFNAIGVVATIIFAFNIDIFLELQVCHKYKYNLYNIFYLILNIL